MVGRWRPEPSQRVLLRLLLRGGPSSRRTLAEAADLDPATVARNLTTLRHRGLVAEVPASGDGPRARGRPPRLVALGTDRHAALGIRLGLSKADLGLMDLGGQVLRSESVAIRPDPQRGLELALEAAADLAALARDQHRELLAGGIAAAGAVDPVAGTVRMRLDDREVSRVDVASAVRKATGAYVHVESLGRAMAIAETWFGGAREAPSIALLYVGRVVRLGIVRNGELDEAEGEYIGMGHAVLDPEGPICYCGQHGCYEVYTSVARLEAEAGRLAIESPRGVLAAMLSGAAEDPLAGIAAAVERRDVLAVRLLDNWARWVARGLVIILHAFQPSRVVIAGPDPLVRPDSLAAVGRELGAISPRLASVPIAASSIPFPEIAVVGAAGLAVDRMLSDVGNREGRPLH